MLDFKFLNKEQLFGDEKLSIIEKRGTAEAFLTDFAILLGAFVDNYQYLDNSNEYKKSGYYWTSSDDKYNNAYVVGCGGWPMTVYTYDCHVNRRDGAARPALSFSTIDDIPISGVATRAEDKILEVEYGYYPQYAVDENMQRELERIYKMGKLLKTGNTFTVDSRKNDDDNCFSPKTIYEYKYKDKRYVRVITNSESGVNLSNLNYYPNGAAVWVEVQPIKWLIDEEEKIMISDKLLFAGVQFKNKIDYKGDFNSTDIKWFMDSFFSKELVQSISEKKKDNIESQNENPSISNFDIDLKTELQDEDSNISNFDIDLETELQDEDSNISNFDIDLETELQDEDSNISNFDIDLETELQDEDSNISNFDIDLETESQDENSSISNFDINLETALRIILSAKENNQKIELHTFDKEEKQKVYTIK